MSQAQDLTLALFAPGMSIMHRAGLGGLACTLKAMEREYANGNLDDRDVPGGPWPAGSGGRPKPPWTIEPNAVTLHFDTPLSEGTYLKRLFRYAFQIRKGLIFLPGQYPATDPRKEVLAELQAGLTLTSLQHGNVRKLAKEETTYSYDPEETGIPGMIVTYKACASYKHQKGWEGLVNSRGSLQDKPVEVIGPLCPGSVVRHVAFKADTRLEDMPALILPLYFALVGCLALPVNRGVGVLIVPDVQDLDSFVVTRPLMTPQSARECRITSAGDAALQAQIRVHAGKAAKGLLAPACYAMTLQPTPWASQQKSRVNTMTVPAEDSGRLDKFRIALAELRPRIAHYTRTEGKGKKKTEKVEYFWADSVIRPLIADNLALGRPWYAGFTRLMVALDANNKPLREKVSFERKGLHAMIEKMDCELPGEDTIVRAVHEALRNRYGQIADENRGNPVAMKNRWKSEYDRWRLAFAGAKTADQLRGALVDLWSRGRTNSALQADWTSVLPLLSEAKWQLVRDLALLALASYQGRIGEGDVEEPSEKPTSAK